MIDISFILEFFPDRFFYFSIFLLLLYVLNKNLPSRKILKSHLLNVFGNHENNLLT